MLDLSSKDVLYAGLIDLDFTFFIQMCLFVLFSILLTKIFFNPYINFHTKRKDMLMEVKKKTEILLNAAEEKVSFYEMEMKKAFSEGIKIRNALKNSAYVEREKIINNAREKYEEIYNNRIDEINKEMEGLRVRLDEKIRHFKNLILKSIYS